MPTPVPGVAFKWQSYAPPRGIVVDGSTFFVVGTAQKGPITGPIMVESMNDFTRIFGSRVSNSILYDAMDAYFNEGGRRAYVSRAIGTSGASASVTLKDSSAANAIVVTAKGPGIWGNNLKAAVIAGDTGGEFKLVISDGTTVVETSTSCANQAAVIAWAANSSYVTVTSSTSTNNPNTVAATALTGGVDDYSPNDTVLSAALDRFGYGLGPGVVAVPGAVSSTVRAALRTHAAANRREALLDATNGSSASALITEGKALQGDEFGAMFGPWVSIPGVVANTTRTVPPSSIVAGLMCRHDGEVGPNEPAAGDNGRCRYATGLTASEFSVQDASDVYSAGINLLVMDRGAVTLNGYRTLAVKGSANQWFNLANQRFRLTLQAELEAAAQSYKFRMIDGKGVTLAAYQGALSGVLLKHYNDGEIYGDTPEHAFYVNVGPDINTTATLEDLQLNAQVGVRMSQFAETLNIFAFKIPLSQTL